MAGDPRVEWSAAFVAAQGDMPDIGKGKKATIETRGGGSYSYAYAALPDVLEAVRPVLKAHGLAVAQSVATEADRVLVETRIYHSGGHVEVFGPLALPAGGDARSVGSAVTYARRYALLAALGVAADEDDDGAAVQKPRETPWEKPAREIVLPHGVRVAEPQSDDEWTWVAKNEAVRLHEGDKEAAAAAYADAVRVFRGELTEDPRKVRLTQEEALDVMRLVAEQVGALK